MSGLEPDGRNALRETMMRKATLLTNDVVGRFCGLGDAAVRPLTRSAGPPAPQQRSMWHEEVDGHPAAQSESCFAGWRFGLSADLPISLEPE